MYKGERFNSITHLVGSIAAIIGLVVLIVTTSRQGGLLSIISVTIYGTTLVMLYVFSTLNHSLRGKAKMIAIKPLIQTLGMAGFSWLLLGGIFYTIGVIFYVYDEQFKYFHGIWHICVLAGSTLQYFTVFYYVL